MIQDINDSSIDVPERLEGGAVTAGGEYTTTGGSRRRRRRQRQILQQQQRQQQNHSAGRGDRDQNHHHPSDEHPLYSFRTIVTVVISFLAIIGIAVIVSSLSTHSNSSSSTTMSSSSSSSNQQQEVDLSSSSQQRSTPKSNLYTNPNDIPLDVLRTLDVIIVLGGGRPTDLENPPIYVKRRADDTKIVVDRIYNMKYGIDDIDTDNQEEESLRRRTQEQAAGGEQDEPEQKSIIPILCLSAGTAHLPQAIDVKGLPLWESTSTAAYLMSALQIPKQDVFVETTSFDTIGNAYWTRTTHTEWNGWRNLLVVTNEFHMDRTQIIFDWIFLQCSANRNNNNNNGDTSTTGRNPRKKKHNNKDEMMINNINNDQYNIYYLSSPNVGLSTEAIQARKEREDASSYNLKTKIIPKYSGSLYKVWEFLMKDHALYTAHKLVERGKDQGEKGVSVEIQKSYGDANAVAAAAAAAAGGNSVK